MIKPHSSLSSRRPFPAFNGLYTPFVLLPFGQWVFDKSPPFPGDRNLQREGVVNRQIPPANISPLMRGVRRGLKSLPSGGELEGSLDRAFLEAPLHSNGRNSIELVVTTCLVVNEVVAEFHLGT